MTEPPRGNQNQGGPAGPPPHDPNQPPGQWGPPQQGQWGPPPPGGGQWQPSNPVPPAPTKSWFARHKVLTTVLALVVLFGIGGVLGGGGGGESTAADATGSSEGAGSSSQEENGSGSSRGDSGNGGDEVDQDGGSTAVDDSQQDPAPKPENPDEGVLRLTVKSTGSDSGSVTFMQPDGNMQLSQNTSASFPWHKAWQDVDSLPMGWNMNAQQNGGGTITCTVELDGEVVAQNTSSGDYAMVTCSE